MRYDPPINRNRLAPDLAAVKDRALDLSDYLDITGTSDGTSGMIAAITAAANGNKTQLYLRSGSTIKITDTINIPDALRNQFALIGDGPIGGRIDATGLGGKPLFVMDPNTTPNTGSRRQRPRIENMYLDGPGKAVSGSKGLVLNNVVSGFFRNILANGFEQGVIWDGLNLASGAAAYYSKAYGLDATNCGVGYYVKGQANSNGVHGGRAALCDTGVIIENSNNVNLIDIDIESNTVLGVDVNANGAAMYGCRFENPGSTYDIRFNDSAGRGVRNYVQGYFSSNNVDSRIQWDAGRNNQVVAQGYTVLGDGPSNSNPYVLGGTRSVTADLKPFIDISDTSSASGSPIGVRYRERRISTHFLAEKTNDGTTFFPVFAARNISNGNAQLTVARSTDQYTNQITWGANTPEGALVGYPGDLFLRTNGGAGTTMYIKETGAGTNTGWVAK